MKNMFKLAAIAVSMILAMSFIACSSGDDVVDATTPKYLVTNQIDKYVESLEYDQNVTDKEIKSLKDAHADMMKILGNCEECLAVYFKYMKDATDYDKLTSQNIETVVEQLKNWKADAKYNTEKEFHKRKVYKVAIEDALKKLIEVETKVAAIEIEKNEKGEPTNKLNERQSATMSAYFDAAAALKAALSEDDAKTCATTIKAADTAIKAFNDLKNKNVTKASIKVVTDKVDAMKTDIQTKIVDKIN